MSFFKRKFFWIFLVLLVLSASFWFFYSRNNDSDLTIASVERGDVMRELFETGTLIKGDRFVFAFLSTGRISNVNVSVGDKVSAGQLLATIEDVDLAFSIREAREGVAVAKAELERVLAGVTDEEIDVYVASVERAEINRENLVKRLEDAEDSLLDVKRSVEASLIDGMEDAITKMKIATEISRSAMLEVANLHFLHFYSSTHRNLALLDAKVRANAMLLGGGDTGRWNVENIANLKEGVWGEVRNLEEDVDFEYIEDLLERTKEAVNRTLLALEAIPFSNVLSSIEKDLIQSHRTAVTQQYAVLSLALESLRTLKVESDILVSSAEREIRTAKDMISISEKDLKEARARLDYARVPVRDQDKAVAMARMEQAKAAVSRLEARTVNNRINSSISGVVSAVHSRKGEVAVAGAPVIEVVPDTQFQIEMFVYEGDVSDMRIGDPVEFEIVAFPTRNFKGVIVDIETVGEMINGVVHYKVLIEPKDDLPAGAFTNMTVDVRAVFTVKEEALLIPDSAISRRDGKVFVEVMRDEDTFEEREIVTGLRSLDRKIEVLEGLSEGEKIILN